MVKKEEMKKIKDEIVNLKESPLYEYRTENNYLPVIGEGTEKANIVFIGEAPGKTEAMTGKPFCGRSGKLLDEMLASIGLDRQKVYITNLAKDRPQDNRDPSPGEIALYSPFLDRQLEIIKPKVIVLLGRLSMNYIFQKTGLEKELTTIGKMHGNLYKGKLSYGKVDILPLYHPAVALYNGGMKKQLFEDFKQVKKFI
jgi:DNA polymerase